jgi:hypothetical protein
VPQLARRAHGLDVRARTSGRRVAIRYPAGSPWWRGGREAVSRCGWRLVVGLGLVAAWAAGEPAAAEQKGIDSTLYYMGSIGCGGPQLEGEGCHANVESDAVTVAIDGLDHIEGDAAAYTATAMTSLEGQFGAGINVLIDAESSTSDCELDTFPTPGAEQLIAKGPVLSHQDAENPPPTGSLGVFSYTFLLANCSTPGSVRLLVAMNTFNFDGESTGDAWNQAEKTVTVPEPGAGAAGAALALTGAALARRRRAIASAATPLPRSPQVPGSGTATTFVREKSRSR